ncbi:MAG: DnaJ domain-containing protein [Ignavibacteria bacterium]|nr:DnaJ domain-containing protein [Ignavibacteria bacterium]
MSQIFERIWKILKSNFTSDNINYSYFDITNEDEKLKAEIEEAWKNNFNKENEKWNKKKISLYEAYKILGVEPNATFEEIKTAYKRKVKQYHPDLVQNMGEEIRELAKSKLQEINLAFELIKKEKGF